MTLLHQVVLYGLLGLLGASLLVPGLVNLLRPRTIDPLLVANSADARSHLRGLNAMMAALGGVAMWACWDLAHARVLGVMLGVVMATLVAARLYSLVVDGVPGRATLLYMAVEALIAAVFLAWPPPA